MLHERFIRFPIAAVSAVHSWNASGRFRIRFFLDNRYEWIEDSYSAFRKRLRKLWEYKTRTSKTFTKTDVGALLEDGYEFTSVHVQVGN